jgi:hypothetical protein
MNFFRFKALEVSPRLPCWVIILSALAYSRHLEAAISLSSTYYYFHPSPGVHKHRLNPSQGPTSPAHHHKVSYLTSRDVPQPQKPKKPPKTQEINYIKMREPTPEFPNHPHSQQSTASFYNNYDAFTSFHRPLQHPKAKVHSPKQLSHPLRLFQNSPKSQAINIISNHPMQSLAQFALLLFDPIGNSPCQLPHHYFEKSISTEMPQALQHLLKLTVRNFLTSISIRSTLSMTYSEGFYFHQLLHLQILRYINYDSPIIRLSVVVALPDTGILPQQALVVSFYAPQKIIIFLWYPRQSPTPYRTPSCHTTDRFFKPTSTIRLEQQPFSQLTFFQQNDYLLSKTETYKPIVTISFAQSTFLIFLPSQQSNAAFTVQILIINWLVPSISQPSEQIIPHYLEYSVIIINFIIFLTYFCNYLNSHSAGALPTTQFPMVYCHILPICLSSVPLISQIFTDSLISVSFISSWNYPFQTQVRFLSVHAFMIQIQMVYCLILPSPRPSSPIVLNFSNIYTFSYNNVTSNPFNSLLESLSLMAYSLSLSTSQPSESSLNHLTSFSDYTHTHGYHIILHIYPCADTPLTPNNHLLFIIPTHERQNISLRKYSSYFSLIQITTASLINPIKDPISVITYTFPTAKSSKNKYQLADGTPDPVPHLDYHHNNVDEPYFSIITGQGPIAAPVPPIDPDG